MRIGFFDTDLDNYHGKKFLEVFRDQLQDCPVEISGCSTLDLEKGKKWAKEHQLKFFSTAEELNHHCDAFIILAPNHPEAKFELCQHIFPFGKPTFIDKTFSPNLKTAQSLFELADQHHTLIESTSGCRYTDIQKSAKELGEPHQIHRMVIFCPGVNLESYFIHPIEIAVSCMGTDLIGLKRQQHQSQCSLELDFSDQRKAYIHFSSDWDTPLSAQMVTTEKSALVSNSIEDHYPELLREVIKFLKSERPPLDRNQTLAVIQGVEAALNPLSLTEKIYFSHS